jgi:hypothetical protein
MGLNGAKPDDGHTWVYGNASTSTLCNHLEKYHVNEYLNACTTHGWTIAIDSLCMTYKKQKEQELAHKQNTKESFTRDGLLKHLVHWIAADDQVREQGVTR